MLIITIAITAVRTAIIHRLRVIPIGRSGVRGITVSIAIIDGWRISIPIAVIPSDHPGVAVIATASREKSQSHDHDHVLFHSDAPP
jgi:hypothetical protein